MDFNLNLGGGGAAGGAGGGSGSGDAYSKAQSDARFAKKEEVTQLDLKVGELTDYITNEELDEIFGIVGLQVVDGFLVGSGELEGDTYIFNTLVVEGETAII